MTRVSITYVQSIPTTLHVDFKMFILRKDRPENSAEEWDRGWQRYQSYLNSISSRLPESALTYAFAEWHYNHLDHRAPHDSWLRGFSVMESTGCEVETDHSTRIVAELLGAYHDGGIEIEYIDVLSYFIGRGRESFGDWLYDEVRLSDCGNVLHEVEFENGSWLIECRNLAFKWFPHD